MNTYRLRPGYGSDKLLIEFIKGTENEAFIDELQTALKDLFIEIKSVHDLWMNDEIMLTLTSSMGSFIFSKDIWGFAFIDAEDNQECILKIDALLSQNPAFVKEHVDFNDYKNASL